MKTLRKIQNKGYKFTIVANRVKGQEGYCFAEKNGRIVRGTSATNVLSKI